MCSRGEGVPGSADRLFKAVGLLDYPVQLVGRISVNLYRLTYLPRHLPEVLAQRVSLDDGAIGVMFKYFVTAVDPLMDGASLNARRLEQFK